MASHKCSRRQLYNPFDDKQKPDGCGIMTLNGRTATVTAKHQTPAVPDTVHHSSVFKTSSNTKHAMTSQRLVNDDDGGKVTDNTPKQECREICSDRTVCYSPEVSNCDEIKTDDEGLLPVIKVQIKVIYKNENRSKQEPTTTTDIPDRTNDKTRIKCNDVTRSRHKGVVKSHRTADDTASARSLLWEISDSRPDCDTWYGRESDDDDGGDTRVRLGLHVPVKYDDSNLFMRRYMLAEGACRMHVIHT